MKEKSEFIFLFFTVILIIAFQINFSKKCLVYLVESVLSEHADFKAVIENVLDKLISSCVEHMKDSNVPPGKGEF